MFIGKTRPELQGPAGLALNPVVLNEGYEDDEDHGDWVIYTGQGGRDPNSGRQIADQELTRGNLALAKSHAEGWPVRVIRGPRLKSMYAPGRGYRYDGLYVVEDYWHERGRAGHLIWRYRLRRDDVVRATWEEQSPPSEPLEPERRVTTIQRIVRNTAQASRVKELYEHECQICGLALETPAGRYAEAAHVQPLGAPHNGPDVVENIICLCPNHHVLFDAGAFVIADDYTLVGVAGVLRKQAGHRIDPTYLAYRRDRYLRGRAEES